MTRREFRDLASPEAVADAVAALDLAGGETEVPVVAANGRTLARRVEAPLDVPGFDRAAMDGYALRASDTFGASEGDPVDLSVVGTVPAGTEPGVEIDGGQAAGIATGAVLPPGADAVVPVERTGDGDETVAVRTAVAPGDHVMSRGADVAAGDHTLGPGTTLGPRHVGLLAALGLETVPVRDAPTVAIVSTGTELVAPGESLRPEAGQIYDVNAASLSAAVERAGGEAVREDAARDDADALRDALERAAEDATLVLTSGSTSAGETDLLPDLVDASGEVLVHGVALKPGRPLLIGRVFDTPFVGLPGYPVSALTVFREFVAPAIREAAGRPAPDDATVAATLATRVRYDGGRLRLLPVGLVPDGSGSHVAYVTAHSSGATRTLVEADGVVRMAAERALLPAGESVTVRRFDDDARLPTLLCVGDPDPVVSRLLDRIDHPRFVELSAADARRWLADDVPDVLVVGDAGPPDDGGDGTRLAAFEREWGLVVPADGPADSIVEDLLAGDVQFASLDTDHSLRGAFDDWLADRDGVADADPTGAIDGADRGLPGLASPAASVASGRADAGLGLRETAERFDLEFVQLGRQRCSLVANPDRRSKASVAALERAVAERLPDLLAERPGYAPIEA